MFMTNMYLSVLGNTITGEKTLTIGKSINGIISCISDKLTLKKLISHVEYDEWCKFRICRVHG